MAPSPAKPPPIDYQRRPRRIPPSPESRAAFFATLSLTFGILSFVLCPGIGALNRPLLGIVPNGFRLPVGLLTLFVLPATAFLSATIALIICPRPERTATRLCAAAGITLALLYAALVILLFVAFANFPGQN